MRLRNAGMVAFVFGVSLLSACGGASGGGGGGGGAGDGGNTPPTCNNTCSTTGQTQCSGTQVQTCQADANGCLAWSAAAACPTGQACAAASNICAAVCNNTCSSQGATQCSGLQVQTCTADTNGCLAWSTAVACGAGQSCSAATNSCQTDPCNGVPTAGVCSDSATIQVCATPSGQGTPAVYTYSCPAGSACSTAGGIAHCANTGTCTPGATVCLDATHLVTCNAGTAVTSTCTSSCLDTAIGSMCTSALPVTPLSFTVKYTLRGPNAGYTDWSTATADVTVSNLLVLSYRGSTLIDSQTTDANGVVTLNVPSSLQSGDIIALVPAASDGAGGLAFLVADPGFAAAGQQQVGTVGTPRMWIWAGATSGFANGGTVTITEAMGSGALRVFDYLRYVYYRSRLMAGGSPGRTVLVWLGYGTLWSCGSCFAQVQTTLSGLHFDSQMFLGGDSNMQYWSDPVTAHELGHWVMASYGTSPGEGGPHVLGRTSFPGLAWSEGWATWHSSDTRSSSIYYDKQSGSMFWIDLAADQYYDGRPWQLPTPSAGLLQRLDENEVASMLWSISHTGAVGAQPLFTALASSQMKSSPWGRGYTRHRWGLDASNQPINVVDTGIPAPCFADFLDTLNCSGVSRSVIDAATVPATQYPYPSGSPICQ